MHKNAYGEGNIIVQGNGGYKLVGFEMEKILLEEKARVEPRRGDCQGGEVRSLAGKDNWP